MSSFDESRPLAENRFESKNRGKACKDEEISDHKGFISKNTAVMQQLASESISFHRKAAITARKKNMNLVKMLQNRELSSSFFKESKRILTSRCVFENFPLRLGFSIGRLVSAETMKNGHIFLGFTKDGQFILSYTKVAVLSQEGGLSYFSYTLHWWLFVPYKPLSWVSSVKLFEDDSVRTDLYIAICHWPYEESQMLVYGYAHWHDGLSVEEEKHIVYVTITARPSPFPCVDCAQIRKNTETRRGNAQAFGTDQPRHGVSSMLCLRHSFCVHTRFELVAPYPRFNPHVSMRKDGTAVMNTGDSIVVLSVQYDDERRKAPRPTATHVHPERIQGKRHHDKAIGDALKAPSSASSSSQQSPRSGRRQRLAVDDNNLAGHTEVRPSTSSRGTPLLPTSPRASKLSASQYGLYVQQWQTRAAAAAAAAASAAQSRQCGPDHQQKCACHRAGPGQREHARHDHPTYYTPADNDADERSCSVETALLSAASAGSCSPDRSPTACRSIGEGSAFDSDPAVSSGEEDCGAAECGPGAGDDGIGTDWLAIAMDDYCSGSQSAAAAGSYLSLI